MIYMPPEYLPSQDGSLYVPGYWDYPLQDRGLLFAPVAFYGTPWIGNPGWCYRPGFTIGLNGLFGSLFIRANTGGYYYGNYYSNGYRQQGYTPWTNYARRGYDPLLNYYSWSNRGTPGWNGNLAGLYTGRLNGSLPAPATTYARQLRPNANVDAALIAPHTAAFGRNLSVNPVNSLQTVHALSQHQGQHVRLTNATATDLASRPAPASRQSLSSSPATLGRLPTATAPQVRSAPAATQSFPMLPSPPQGGGFRTPTLPISAASGLRPPVTLSSPNAQPTFRAQSPSAPAPAPPIVTQRTPVPQARVAPPAITHRAPTPQMRVTPPMHAAPVRTQPAPAVRPAPARPAAAVHSAPVQRPAPASHGHSAGRKR
jgi:hypothetical protein